MLRPALIGAMAIGVLSALPVVSAGNLCCCLWVVAGGVIAAYFLQQNRRAPVTLGEGALVGLMAGILGAFVYLVLSIPVTILLAPMQSRLVEQFVSRGTMPPEFREFLLEYAGGALGLAIGFFAMLAAGVVFAPVGGLIGAAVFRKGTPPAGIDALQGRVDPVPGAN